VKNLLASLRFEIEPNQTGDTALARMGRLRLAQSGHPDTLNIILIYIKAKSQNLA
jgi:hypothetical protein